MQEFSNSVKKANMRIMGIEEGEEVQAKIKKKKNSNLPNPQKVWPIRYRKLPGHQTDLTKIKLPHGILSLKQQAQRTEKEYLRM
jgi:hypothetical protein